MKALKHTLFAIVLLLSGMVASIHVSAAEMTDCTHFGPTMAIAPGSDGDAMRTNGFLNLAPKCIEVTPAAEECPATVNELTYLALTNNASLLKVASTCRSKVKTVPIQPNSDDRICRIGDRRHACASPD